MKAFTINRYGKNESLHFADMPMPDIGDHDVLVQTYAAGINRLDSMIKNGEFKLLLRYELPLILGNDVAGVVTKIGSKVQSFKVGDEIYARPDKDRIGTFAEYIAMHERDVALRPKNITMEEAASIPLVGLTAWQSLVEIANLSKGQKVFIQAGSGGVGTIAIQLAKWLGATVATTASQKSSDLVKSLGADVVIDYQKDDFETTLSDYDVVLHSQDQATLQKSLRILKPGGKLISLSGPPTPEFAAEVGAPLPVRLVMKLLSRKTVQQAKKLGVDYSFLFMRASGEQLQRITALVETGEIRPVIDRVFPFEQTHEAVTYVESARAKGKVVTKIC
ncbi:MAG: NADP-dependent oxidoreductase [Anaerolineae bacterium]|nr:NADP-dependent oxidoreductase [Anaerolineae bacterium]